MRLHELMWDTERFSTGITAIDSQHREFLMLANRILDLIGQGFINGALQKAIDELIAFARMHFEFEERLMTEHGYADADSHIKDHLKLMDQLNTLKKNIPTSAGSKVHTELFTAFLIDLVELHLMHTDGALTKFLAPDAPCCS